MATRASKLNDLQNIIKMSIYYEDDKIVFITTIPLITDIEFTMYNAIPTPLLLNRNHITRWYVIFPTHEYIAITKDRKRYTAYTAEEFILS